MESIIFTENPKEKFEDFKKFIGDTENSKLVNVTMKVGEEVVLFQVKNVIEMLNDILNEETDINVEMIIDKQLPKKQIIFKAEKIFN